MTGESPRKKPKMESEPKLSLSDLSSVKILRKLSENPDKKTIVFEGVFNSHPSISAIFICEKSPFDMESLQESLNSAVYTSIMKNDVYSQFNVTLDFSSRPSLALNLIFPASEKHFSKYTDFEAFMIDESSALYNVITKPYLEKQNKSLDWMTNILDHKKEMELILYENNDPNSGFILLKDFKWNGVLLSNLHVLALCHSRNIGSLRDLNASHLKLLEGIAREGPRVIQEKYGVYPSQLRVYVHYQPSNYHFHVHFTNLTFDLPGISFERAHGLSSIISNIKRDSFHYSRALLTFGVKRNDGLFDEYQSFGYPFISLTRFSSVKNEEYEEDNENNDKEKIKSKSLLSFFRLCHRAKHEPCREDSLASYGDSAWRLSLLSLLVSDISEKDRLKLVKTALSSSFTSFGFKIDEESNWSSKLSDVKKTLFASLPFEKAVEAYDHYSFHVSCRTGKSSENLLGTLYRSLLELEEYLYTFEELRKESFPLGSESDYLSVLYKKLSSAQISGFQKMKYFDDKSALDFTLSFIHQISKCQKLPRKGWLYHSIESPENVASHMFRMGLMAIFLGNDDGNKDAIYISLIHDMAECIIGDITPHDNVSPEEKAYQENKAMKELTRHLESTLGSSLLCYFRRYEDAKDSSALLTKDLDKLDMIITAFDYEEEKETRNLQEFFDGVQGVFRTPAVKNIVGELLELRASRKKNVDKHD